MSNRKTLKEKIVQSVFVYETKRMTVHTVVKLLILLISVGIILVFGGVIGDLFTEGEMSGLIGEFIKVKEYSYSKIIELGSVIFGEIPQWLIFFYIGGVLLGCILIMSIVKNGKLIVRKVRSIAHYWFKA